VIAVVAQMPGNHSMRIAPRCFMILYNRQREITVIQSMKENLI